MRPKSATDGERGRAMCPELDLWVSVVVLAIRDAQSGDAEARNWLFSASRDMRRVCGLAGLDPEVLQR